MALFFRGGIHPYDMKKFTAHKTIEKIPPPVSVVLPMSMHIGAPCKPLVKAGDAVALGQKIGDSDEHLSAPVHASVSGKVTAVEPRPHPNGTNVLSVVIENDYNDTLHESVRPFGSVSSLSGEAILRLIRASGIVGLGGATFPTHAKISAGLGSVETLIINCAECEPYITSDHRIMLEHPEEVIGGTHALMKVFGLTRAVIAVESNKFNAIEKLRSLIGRSGDIEVKALHTIYPQGAEKQLVRTVTGKEIPPGKFPADVGCAVYNTDTAAAVHRAITTGMPLVRRIVTVSGSAVSNPKNLYVPIGTPLENLIEATGGFKDEPKKVIMGGPMMGVAQHNLQVPVIKATNALLSFSKNEDATVKNPVCIRCGKCVGVCPMKLLPIYLYMYQQKEMYDECASLNVSDCIECGSCAYVCPGRLYLVQSMRTAKAQLAKKSRR